MPARIVPLVALCLFIAPLGCRNGTPKPAAAPSAAPAGGITAPAADAVSPAPVPVPPVELVPPPEPRFSGFAPEGAGHPSEFLANRPAVLHVAGRTFTLPATLWFTDATAPGGSSPVLFRIRPGGSGYYDFTFSPTGEPCRFTAPDGSELAVSDVKLGLDADDEAHVRTVFRLTLDKP